MHTKKNSYAQRERKGENRADTTSVHKKSTSLENETI